MSLGLGILAFQMIVLLPASIITNIKRYKAIDAHEWNKNSKLRTVSSCLVICHFMCTLGIIAAR